MTSTSHRGLFSERTTLCSLVRRLPFEPRRSQRHQGSASLAERDIELWARLALYHAFEATHKVRVPEASWIQARVVTTASRTMAAAIFQTLEGALMNSRYLLPLRPSSIAGDTKLASRCVDLFAAKPTRRNKLAPRLMSTFPPAGGSERLSQPEKAASGAW